MTVVLAGTAALGLGATACGDDGPDPATSSTPEAQAERGASAGSVEQPQRVTGGSTILRLDTTALSVLDAVGVDVQPVGETTLEDGRLRFPITGGSVDIDSPSGAIQHAGGVGFSGGGRQLVARDLVIRPGDGIVTAEIGGERVPFFPVSLDPLTVPTGDRLALSGRATAISSEMVAELEQQLGVTLPDLSLRLGRLDVSAET
jgi:hypothetical protein